MCGEPPGIVSPGSTRTARSICFSIQVQAAPCTASPFRQGRILVAGSFSTAGGGTRNNIARLNPDGALDTGFNPNANSVVTGALAQADGEILIAGPFTTVGGTSRNRIARLGNSLATQSLTLASASRIEWQRGGTSPETQNVAFELSSDGGSTWLPLGPGTRIAGGWERAGLALPTSGRIRGRAVTIGGLYSGSSSIAEATFAFGVQPEITVEQPVLSGIADGGTKDFGSVTVSTNPSATFTIRNTGAGELTGITVTKSGANATDFTLISVPAALLSGGSATTFTLRFSPATVGFRTAAIHIASNDADENPFDINLTGRGTTPGAGIDSDGDGVPNEVESI